MKFDLHNWRLFIIIDQIFRWKEIQYPIKEDQIGNVMEFPSRSNGIMQNYFAAKIAFWTGNFPVGKNTCLSSPREGKLDGKSPMHCWPFLSTKIHQKLSLQPAWMAWEKVFRNSEWQWTLPSFTTNYWLNYKRLPTYLPSVTFLWKIFLIAQKWKVFMNRGIML